MGKIRVLFALIACIPLVAARPAAAPSTPVITEPSIDGMILNPADVHMEAGSFSDPDGNTHASTDWEIWKVSTSERIWQAPAATGLMAVHIHLADGAFIGSYAGRTTLEYGTDYTLHVRFRDSAAEVGGWAVRLFKTSAPGPQGVLSPMPWVPGQPGYRVEVFASGFRLPVNIAFLPNAGPAPTDPYFYVTELYGTIKVVARNGSVSTYASGLLNYDPTALGSFPGAGEQGLAGICVDPATGDVFATMLYQFDATTRYPKVVRFTSADGGRTAATQTTILDMAGAMQGQSHQVSNVSIGPDGKLYVHNGDGFETATAQDLASYKGKILRINLDGSVPADNPLYNAGDGINPKDYTYAYGLRNPFGGAWRASDSSHYEVENGPSVDRFAKITAGTNYLWNGTDASMGALAKYNWNPAHAPVNIVFAQPSTFGGSGLPAGKMDHAFVTESGPTHAAGPQPLGKRITEFTLDASGNVTAGPTDFMVYNGTGYATAVALAAGPDGLYFSDLYKDQAPVTPADAGANILRVSTVGLPAAGTGAGLLGEYYDDIDFTNLKLTRTDPAVDFNWAGAPDPSMGAATFSVRWTGWLVPQYTDTCTFYAQSNDGVRLWVDGALVISNWTDHASTENAATVALTAGQAVAIRLDYYNNAAPGVIKLSWSCSSLPKSAVPATQLYASNPAASPAPAPGTGSKKKRCGASGAEAAVLLGLFALLRRRP